jgi:hypothetical protein
VIRRLSGSIPLDPDNRRITIFVNGESSADGDGLVDEAKPESMADQWVAYDREERDVAGEPPGVLYLEYRYAKSVNGRGVSGCLRGDSCYNFRTTSSYSPVDGSRMSTRILSNDEDGYVREHQIWTRPPSQSINVAAIPDSLHAFAVHAQERINQFDVLWMMDLLVHLNPTILVMDYLGYLTLVLPLVPLRNLVWEYVVPEDVWDDWTVSSSRRSGRSSSNNSSSNNNSSNINSSGWRMG